jgi:hypothetical protein
MLAYPNHEYARLSEPRITVAAENSSSLLELNWSWKMDAMRSIEKSVNFSQNTPRHSSEESNLHIFRIHFSDISNTVVTLSTISNNVVSVYMYHLL